MGAQFRRANWLILGTPSWNPPKGSNRFSRFQISETTPHFIGFSSRHSQTERCSFKKKHLANTAGKGSRLG